MPRAIEIFGAAVLVTSCIVGGSFAAGRVLPALPELLSLPLLTLAATAESARGGAVPRRWWIAGAILVLPLMQLVPLPPDLWAALPGRRPVAEAYAATGLALPWMPVSLTPSATERFWLALLPPVALFLALPRLGEAAQRRLVHLAIVIGLFSVVLGLAQIAEGPQSPLRPYAASSRTDAVGLFANRNHHATFLALLLLLAGALFAAGRGKARLAERSWLGAAGVLFLLGIAASGSRAGLLLGMGAALAVGWVLVADGMAARRGRSFLIWGGIAAIPLLVGFAVFGAAALRLQSETVSDDLRWQIARVTWHALAGVFPVGGGFGSFERLYAQAEPPEMLMPAVVNNAHDDWLELVLEGGLPALLLLLCGLAYLLRATFGSDARPGGDPFARAVGSTTLAALWLCALHATVDYPLRTMSVSVIFALACGLRAGRVAGPAPDAAAKSGRGGARPGAARFLPGTSRGGSG